MEENVHTAKRSDDLTLWESFSLLQDLPCSYLVFPGVSASHLLPLYNSDWTRRFSRAVDIWTYSRINHHGWGSFDYLRLLGYVPINASILFDSDVI
jgi:hypothetical protein